MLEQVALDTFKQLSAQLLGFKERTRKVFRSYDLPASTEAIICLARKERSLYHCPNACQADVSTDAH